MRTLNNPSWVLEWSGKDDSFHRYSCGVRWELVSHWGSQMHIYQGPTAATAMAPGEGVEEGEWQYEQQFKTPFPCSELAVFF